MYRFRNLAAAIALTLTTCFPPAQSAELGTGPSGSLSNNLGIAVAGAAQGASVDLLARPFDDPGEALALVASGDLPLALSDIHTLRSAQRGIGIFEGGAHPELRAVARLIENRIALFVPLAANVQSIAGLKGKRVPVGFEDQPVAAAALDALLAAAGLTEDDVEGVPVRNLAESASAVLEERADVLLGLIFDQGLLRVDRELGRTRGMGARGGLQILEVPEDPVAIERMEAAFPDATTVVTGPIEGRPGFERTSESHLPGIERETRTMAYDTLIVGGADNDAELVQGLVTALARDQRWYLMTGEPQYISFSKRRMATDYSGVEYHSGAINAYRELGIWPND